MGGPSDIEASEPSTAVPRARRRRQIGWSGGPHEKEVRSLKIAVKVATLPHVRPYGGAAVEVRAERPFALRT
jgi:hypothetical protein